MGNWGMGWFACQWRQTFQRQFDRRIGKAGAGIDPPRRAASGNFRFRKTVDFPHPGLFGIGRHAHQPMPQLSIGLGGDQGTGRHQRIRVGGAAGDQRARNQHFRIT